MKLYIQEMSMREMELASGLYNWEQIWGKNESAFKGE